MQPEGDKRLRDNWINAIADATLPLLQLLKDSPAAEVEPIVNSSPDIIDSKFGRIVYPKPAAKLIAQTENNFTLKVDELDATKTDAEPTRGANTQLHNLCLDAPELDASIGSFQVEHRGNPSSDRLLEAARNSEGDKRRALLDRPNELAAALDDEHPPNRGDGKSRIESKVSQSAIGSCASPVIFSPRFLATYPPYFGEVHYKADINGQLSLLESVETSDEPPDPDDFQTLAEFHQAIALWDAEHPEPLEISLDSMCEWAPCPDEWYEPDAAESSSTCNFSIPTFDAWCDRANRQTDSDEPPDTGNYARLPGPKPPKFPPRAIGQSHTKRSPSAYQAQAHSISIASQSHNSYIAVAGSSRLGRSPPGGDVM